MSEMTPAFEHRGACGRPAAGPFAQSRPLDYTPLIVAIPVPDGRFGMAGGIATIQPDHALRWLTICFARSLIATDLFDQFPNASPP